MKKYEITSRRLSVTLSGSRLRRKGVRTCLLLLLGDRHVEKRPVTLSGRFWPLSDQEEKTGRQRASLAEAKLLSFTSTVQTSPPFFSRSTTHHVETHWLRFETSGARRPNCSLVRSSVPSVAEAVKILGGIHTINGGVRRDPVQSPSSPSGTLIPAVGR